VEGSGIAVAAGVGVEVPEFSSNFQARVASLMASVQVTE